MAFTFFFRDAQTLELAVETAMPLIQGQAFIHLWDAGCAHGPEPYTLAILLRERMSEFLFRNVCIHATDIETVFAEKVGAGVFPEGEVKRIPPELLSKYFCPAEPGHVRVAEAVRSRISFEVHDLLSLSPIRQDLPLIVCKNVLLHFDEQQRAAVLRMFHDALRPGGVLALEHTQKLPAELEPAFAPVRSYAQVFRKIGVGSGLPARLPLAAPHGLGRLTCSSDAGQPCRGHTAGRPD